MAIDTSVAQGPPAAGSTPADDSVTDAIIRESAALSVIGRAANSTGNPADITAGSDGAVLRRSGTTLGFGTIATAGITDDAVSDAKLRDSAALSVIGRSANSTGDPADIAAGSDGAVLRRSGTTLGFGTIATAGIGDAQVTKAKIENVAADKLLGRGNGGGAGAPQEITLGTGLSMSGTTLSASAGAWTTVTVGTGNNFTISSLDGDNVNGYEFIFGLEKSSTNGIISIQPNGGTSDQAYAGTKSDSSTVAAHFSSGIELNATGFSKIQGKLTVLTNRGAGSMTFHWEAIEHSGTSSNKVYAASAVWYANTANLTSLVFDLQSTFTFVSGSWCKYRSF